MFGAVAFLAVRQYRFELLTVRRVEDFEKEVHAAVKSMAEGQVTWTERTATAIQDAINPRERPVHDEWWKP
jgi:phenolic acid decarboxylase